jgi:hypothetical protein
MTAQDGRRPRPYWCSPTRSSNKSPACKCVVVPSGGAFCLTLLTGSCVTLTVPVASHFVSGVMSAAGQKQPLAAAREAVTIRRDLARARPEAFTPDLAGSLNNLANRLSELGQREEALAAAKEAAGFYRDLARARPEAFTPDLAMSLNNLAARLSELGQREEALAAGRTVFTST